MTTMIPSSPSRSATPTERPQSLPTISSPMAASSQYTPTLAAASSSPLPSRRKTTKRQGRIRKGSPSESFSSRSRALDAGRYRRRRRWRRRTWSRPRRGITARGYRGRHRSRRTGAERAPPPGRSDGGGCGTCSPGGATVTARTSSCFSMRLLCRSNHWRGERARGLGRRPRRVGSRGQRRWTRSLQTGRTTERRLGTARQ